MSTSTANFGFVKAAGGEKYSRILTNNNLDAIDAAIADSNAAQHLEMVNPMQNDAPAGVMWGPGGIFSLKDEAKSKNYTDWTGSSPGNDSIRLTKAGLYLFEWKIVNNSADSRSFWHTICTDGSSSAQANATSIGRTQTDTVFQQDPYFCYGRIFIPTDVNTDIFFKYSVGTASPTFAHRIKVSRIGT